MQHPVRHIPHYALVTIATKKTARYFIKKLAMPITLSYWPQPLSIKMDKNLRYVFNAANSSLPLYFALKQKHNYALANQDDFMRAIRPLVELAARDYDLVVYPESRFSFVSELVTNLPSLQLKKRSKEEVIELARANAGWSKQERQSQQRCWQEMGTSFTINSVKTNQRKHYVPYLFEPVRIQEQRVLFIDDFIMSGNTQAAAWAALERGSGDCFAVFYQPDYRG